VKMLAYDRFKPGVARAQAAAAVSPDPAEVAYEGQRSSPRLAFRATAYYADYRGARSGEPLGGRAWQDVEGGACCGHEARHGGRSLVAPPDQTRLERVGGLA
jgi:hypothetical protein